MPNPNPHRKRDETHMVITTQAQPSTKPPDFHTPSPFLLPPPEDGLASGLAPGFMLCDLGWKFSKPARIESRVKCNNDGGQAVY